MFCGSISKDNGVTGPNNSVDARAIAIYTNGHNTVKSVAVFNLCILSDNDLYLYQVSRKYRIECQRVSELLTPADICILKFAKEQNSVKSVGRVKILVLCTSSDIGLYLYQVLPKYLTVPE